MPINNNLPDIKLPVKLKTGKKTVTEFREQLQSIHVELMHAPTLDDLLSYIPEFATATWRDSPRYSIVPSERFQIVKDLFDGKLLPTALETINLTFRIEGIDVIDVTHLLRHRMFSFSAQCTADRDQRDDPVVVKPGIMKHPEFYDRYREITQLSKQLYADMVDSGTISILDARTILTKNLSTFYYAKGSLNNIFAYIGQRLDEQIQPTSDNVVAMLMFLRLAEYYPVLANKFKIGGPDHWYQKTVPTGRGSNIYMPKKENDTFDYKENWFLYNKRREDFPGNDVYQNIKLKIVAKLNEIKHFYGVKDK